MTPKIVFSDFDGTLTDKGRLSRKFFDVLDLCHTLSSELIIVSGRSLSWGHFLLTHFEINFAIMEGGGVYLYKSDGQIKEKYLTQDLEIKKLLKIERELIKKFPNLIMSPDNTGRVTDRAIEKKGLKGKTLTDVQDFLENSGAYFALSNVHLNYWTANISKSRAIKMLLDSFYPEVSDSQYLFFGDAKNDESVFKNHKNTIGVSNISHFLETMEFRPKITLEGEENEEVNGVLNYLKNLIN